MEVGRWSGHRSWRIDSAMNKNYSSSERNSYVRQRKAFDKKSPLLKSNFGEEKTHARIASHTPVPLRLYITNGIFDRYTYRNDKSMITKPIYIRLSPYFQYLSAGAVVCWQFSVDSTSTDYNVINVLNSICINLLNDCLIYFPHGV